MLWVAFLFSGDLPDLGIGPRSPALQEDSLPSEPPGKPQTYVKPLKLGIRLMGELRNRVNQVPLLMSFRSLISKVWFSVHLSLTNTITPVSVLMYLESVSIVINKRLK